MNLESTNPLQQPCPLGIRLSESRGMLEGATDALHSRRNLLIRSLCALDRSAPPDLRGPGAVLEDRLRLPRRNCRYIPWLVLRRGRRAFARRLRLGEFGLVHGVALRLRYGDAVSVGRGDLAIVCEMGNPCNLC